MENCRHCGEILNENELKYNKTTTLCNTCLSEASSYATLYYES